MIMTFIGTSPVCFGKFFNWFKNIGITVRKEKLITVVLMSL